MLTGTRPRGPVVVFRPAIQAVRGAAGDVVARRWCDLLVLEALALDAVSSRGLSVARTVIVDTASHYFLESERFDRVGIRGRTAVMTLAAAHDDPVDPWARAAVLLKNAGRLSDEDARRLRWLDAFGALIANTDRHPYNVVFLTEGATLRLAPGVRSGIDVVRSNGGWPGGASSLCITARDVRHLGRVG